MKQLLIIICIITFSVELNFAQDSIKTNPIIFVEGYLGVAVAGLSGFYQGANLNYQTKNSLLSFRTSSIPDFSLKIIDPIIPLPYFLNNGHADEYSFLYGLRTIKNIHSYSFSVGVSYNYRFVNSYDKYNQLIDQTRYNYAGIPFELNIKWFQREKNKYRIYYLIPRGTTTGFGASFGFKLAGNLSKYSYLAMGLVVGLDFHKHY